MLYAMRHDAVDSFVGMGKNAPTKSPAGAACQDFAARLCRPPLFGRYAPSSLRPIQPRKTSRLRIYRTDVALTEVRTCVMGLRTRIVSDILPGKEKSPDGIVSGPTAVCPNTPAGGSGGQSQ